MESWQEIVKTTVLGISLPQLGLAFLWILAGALVRFMVLTGLHRSHSLALQSDRVILAGILKGSAKPLGVIALWGGIWLALLALPLPTEPFDVDRLLFALVRAGMILLGAWLGISLADAIVHELLGKAKRTETPLDDQLLPVARSTMKLFFIVIALVMILQELGYSVASLLAGFGLGGAAIALASKDTLANLFGSVVIFVDRPFVIGDWIEVGGIEGTVEEVGLRVTRIRTFANSLITLPNANLTTTAINNWSRMQKRRITFTLGLTYDTPPAKLQEAVQRLKQVIADDARMDHSFYLVNFNAFGPYSLDLFIYCFTKTTQWAEYLQVREELLLAFMHEIHALGLSFAFPTQTLHLPGGSNPAVAPGRQTPSEVFPAD
ncbi:mechanosensitive ion channel [bacterium]|nr:mechanosensitive ion channel [bacterium]